LRTLSAAPLLVYVLGVFIDKMYGLLSLQGKLPNPSRQPAAGTLLTHVSCRILLSIITILLLAADFYYLKNIAGRRLVGLRWWNEVDPATGDSKWVFESSEPGTKVINATDSRFFWLANYLQPLLWVGMAILALVRLKFIWLPLDGWSHPARLCRDWSWYRTAFGRLTLLGLQQLRSP
jgi:hypothetical protein